MLVPAANALQRFLPPLSYGQQQQRGLRRALSIAIQEAYEGGFFGCFTSGNESPEWARQAAERGRDEFRDTAGRNRWLVAQIMPTAVQGAGRGKRALNWVYTQQARPNAYAGSQDYGNCRAWSMRACTSTLLGMAAATGDLKRLDVRHGTALVYAHRGHSSDGMAMGTGCTVVTTIGQSEEKNYGEGLDLSTEEKDEAAGARWGRSGPPQSLLDACRGDLVQRAWALGGEVTADMVQDVFWNEGVIDHGSNRTAGAASDGLISPLKRIGGHAQAALGYDDTDEFRAWYREATGKVLTEAVVINDQSWGNWLSLSRWPDHLWGPRPEGAWVVTMSDFLAILRNWGDGWAMTGASGFVPRRLPDFGTAAYL